MPVRLHNAKLNKEDVHHTFLRVVFTKALSGDRISDLAISRGATEITLESILQSESAKCLERPSLRTTFLVSGDAVDPLAKLWDLASDESMEGRATTKHIEIFVVHVAQAIRLVPFVSLGERRPSVLLRDLAFDVQTSSTRSKILLREIASDWLGQIRGDRSEMAYLFGLLLEELVVTNAAARKRNVLHGLDFGSRRCRAAAPVEQYVTIVFDNDHAPHCRFNDGNRVFREPSQIVLQDLVRKLRRRFG